MKVCIAVQGLTPKHVERLQTALREHAVIFAATGPEAERRTAVANAAVIFGNIPTAWLDAAPYLRWVQLDSAGVDAYLRLNEVRRAAPVVLTHLRGFYDRAVAEAALAGILALYRQLPPLLAAQAQSRWIKTDVEPLIRALDGGSVLILGAGAISQRLTRLLNAFDARCRCYARTPRAGQLHTEEALHRALGETDLLINTLPHTPETNGFLDRAKLSRLKPGAVVCNVGRGSTLDETALVDLLDTGHLGGAALDVTAVEPLPTTSPLWRHPRVVLTQHTGGRFPGETDRKLDVFLENFSRFANGQPLLHEVAVARGY